MADTTSYPVTILKAVEADIPSLATINTHAYLPELFLAFVVTDWPNPASFQIFFKARAAHNIRDPNTEVYKIINSTSHEILGFVCLSRSEGKRDDGRSNPAGNFEPPPGSNLNLDFLAMCARELVGLEECVTGINHFVLTSFAIHPKYQKRGLGTKLLQHCIGISDEAGLPIYLNDFPGAHQLYLNFGFEVKGVWDCDLNEYGPNNRGFGVYRSCAMLRQPVKEKK